MNRKTITIGIILVALLVAAGIIINTTTRPAAIDQLAPPNPVSAQRTSGNLVLHAAPRGRPAQAYILGLAFAFG